MPAHQSANAAPSPKKIKSMTEITMLTYLIPAAAAIKNGNGDTSLYGYVENHGITKRQELKRDDDELKFAVLDSIGDMLLQKHHILAISPDKEKREQSFIPTAELKADSDLELPAEDPINGASMVSSISASVVPNPDDRGDRGNHEGGPLNLREVREGNSRWVEVKKDSLRYAVE